jgi:hypothetical protein
MGPTLAGFLEFIRNVVGISTDNLPDASPIIPVAYNVAVEIVNLGLKKASPTLYVLAVYNLATDNIINYAPNPVSPPGVVDYFSALRTKWHIEQFVSGVIQSSSDESTSNSLVVQEAAKMFTLGNLQNLKTPYGRRYLSIAQSMGPTVIGLS